MTDKTEEKLRKGRAVWEMTQTEGWQIIRKQLEDEIQMEINDLVDCPNEEDEEHKQAIKAYRKVLSMVETADKEKQDAAKAVRKE